MLDLLDGKVSQRKLRLVSVACCRPVWDAFQCAESRAAVEIGERYADGGASARDLAAARARAMRACREQVMASATCRRSAQRAAAEAVGALYQALNAIVSPVPQVSDDPSEQDTWESACYYTAVQEHRGRQVQALHDLFGPLPFRPVALDPAWLRWNWGTVPAIARRVYDDRAFHDLPILADALTDAGCDNEEIIAHCRTPGPHVRGCWVVDLLLGKE